MSSDRRRVDKTRFKYKFPDQIQKNTKFFSHEILYVEYASIGTVYYSLYDKEIVFEIDHEVRYDTLDFLQEEDIKHQEDKILKLLNDNRESIKLYDIIKNEVRNQNNKIDNKKIMDIIDFIKTTEINRKNVFFIDIKNYKITVFYKKTPTLSSKQSRMSTLKELSFSHLHTLNTPILFEEYYKSFISTIIETGKTNTGESTHLSLTFDNASGEHLFPLDTSFITIRHYNTEEIKTIK